MFKKFLAGALSVAMMFGMASVLPEEVTDKLGFEIEANAATETEGDYKYTVLDNGTVEISKYIGNEEMVAIPDTISGKKVTSIGLWAFNLCKSIVSVKIPEGVTSIADEAFRGCQNLESIIIPDSVNSIGYIAFYECESLKEVTIPNSVTSLGDGTFYRCVSLTDVTIPDGIKRIGRGMFYECSSLKSIAIPNSVTSIEEGAFLSCRSLTDVTNPDSVTSIADDAFGFCTSLTSITIPDSVTSIGDYAFDVENTIIYCYSNSTAEQYAIDNNINYVLLDAPQETDLSTCTATLSYTAITYSPDGINADKYLTVKDGSKTLVQGVDYETSYKNNKAVGYQTCTLTIAGKGDYSGTIYKKLTIKPPKLAAPTLTTKNSAIVVNWKKTTTYALGYQVIYDKVADFDTSAAGHTDDYHTTTITDLDTLTKTLSAYTKPGETWYVKVRAFITNDGTTGGTRYGTFSAAKKIVVKGNVSTASIPYASYTYSGSAIKPAVTVKDSKGNKLSASNYTVDYTNNTKVGTAAITITGKGNYQGTITKTFVIKPKAGTLTLTAGTAAFKASWTKNTTATGYRITYSKDKSFASGVYNYTVSKNTTTSANFSSKPKSGETWYVKYRPYITVNGTKYYGSYSAVKTVKTK